MQITVAVARSYDASLVLEGVNLDDPRDGEIVVRLIASGVSRFDRDAIAGMTAMPLPFVPGGEGVGLVEHVGAGVSDLVVGDAVLLTASACGHCRACRESRSMVCEAFSSLNLSGRRPDGSTPFTGDQSVGGFFLGQSSFATHALCRASGVVKLPTEAPLELFAGLGGEALTTAAVVLAADAGGSLLVVGAGAAGLVATMVAKARGATLIVVVDRDEGRRNLASDLGATIVLHDDSDIVASVRSMAADGVTLAFETSGGAAMQGACRDCLAPGGVCVVVSGHGGPEVSANGSFDARDTLAALLELYVAGRLPIEKLIAFFPFEHVNDALAALNDPRIVKPVIRFSLGSFGDIDRAQMEGSASELTDGSSQRSVPAEASVSVTSEKAGEGDAVVPA